jgi:hypothetical protein
MRFLLLLLALAAAAGARIIAGQVCCAHFAFDCAQGAFQYEYVPEKLKLPPGVDLLNGHGLARGRDGSIYFTYESASVGADTRALIRFSPDGMNATLLGPDNELAHVSWVFSGVWRLDGLVIFLRSWRIFAGLRFVTCFLARISV